MTTTTRMAVNIRTSPRDIRIIDKLRVRFGLRSRSDLMRLALDRLHETVRGLDLPLPPLLPDTPEVSATPE